jgi:hypothetical protein
MNLSALVVLFVGLCGPASKGAVFELPKDDNLVVVPVRIANEDHLFVIDTGSTGLVLDESLRPHLGAEYARKRVVTPLGETQITVYEPPDIWLGDVNLGTGSKAICRSFEGFRKATGRNVRGIIGMAQLRRFVLTIDFDAHTAELRSGGAGPLDPRGSFELKLDKSGAPCIDVVVNKVVESFVIDTGGEGVFVEKRLRGRLADAGLLEAVGRSKCGSLFGNFESTVYAYQGEFSLGHFTHRRILLDEAQENILGLSYLSRYKVTFDFPQRRLYLSKGKGFDAVEQADGSGLRLVRENGRTLVDSVAAGSPAETAELRAGDELAQVNGKNAALLSLSAIRRLLRSNEGRHVDVVVLRDGSRKDVKLALKPYYSKSE